MPDLRATRDAVRTTLSVLSDCSPFCARLELYKFVVATLRNAKRYTDPSMKVVAGCTVWSYSAQHECDE